MIKGLILVAVAYLLICLLAYLFQEKLMFFPERLPADYEYEYDTSFEELDFRTGPKTLINALLFRSEKPKGLVYYFHGNAGSLRSWGNVAGDLVSLGYDVLIIDYRGYGKSSGRMSEKGLYHDAQYIYDEMRQRYGEEKIILYGRSIGSAPAAYVASRNKPRMLVLEAPFYNLKELARRTYPILPTFLLRYSYRVNELAAQASCPVHIFHGDRDEVIDYSYGVKLAEELGSRGRLYTIEGGHHNDLDSFPEYQEKLGEVLGSKN